MEVGMQTGGRSIATRPVGPRADRIVGILVLLFVGAVYCVTLAPTVSFWDSGEFIAASYTLGVPHPPGTPLYVILGRVFSLFPGVPVPVAVNLLSAIPGAFAGLFLYLSLLLIGKRMLPGVPDAMDRWALRIGAAAGGLFASFGATCWRNATEAEVYAPSLFVMALCLWILLRSADRAEPEAERGPLLLIAYLLSLSIGVHLGTYLAVLPFLLFLLIVDRRVFLDGRFLALAVFLTLLGLTVHFYLPIRSTLNPLIDEANPERRHAFLDFLLRKQYKPMNPFVRQAPWAFQLRMFWTYFGDQYGALLPLLGLAGVWAHARRARRTFILYATLFLITSLFLIFYMNFTEEEVRERDYFFAPAFFFWGGWMGLGCVAIVGWARDAARRLRLAEGAMPAVLAGLLALLPAVVVARSFTERDRRGNYFAYDYAWNILTSLEPDAVLFTNGDNDTFPLWFLQEVEGVRRDVRVANLALLNTPWYVWQLKNLEPKVPFELTDDEIESLRPYRTREGDVVSVKDQAVIEIARANRWKRPLYFAVTVPDLMGLDERKLVRLEGLVYRVMPTAQEDFVDLEKTGENLWSHYRFRGVLAADGVLGKEVVRDWNEEKLIANYSAAFSRLAIQLRNSGRLDEAIRAMEMAREISPGHRVVEGLLGPLYAEAGMYDRAETVFTRQLGEHPDSLSPHLGLAFVRERQGLPREADSLYREAVRIDPEHREARMRLAALRLRVGDLRGGADVLREWLAFCPSDTGAEAELRNVERAMERGAGTPQ